jgi:hypothetical protein
MARPRRQNLQLALAQKYLEEQFPEVGEVTIRIRQLDGPPGSPRYAATAEICSACTCPQGVPRAQALAGECAVARCPMRRTIRLLLSRDGELMQVTNNELHWSNP